MKHITEFDDDQVGRREFRTLQRAVIQKLGKTSKRNDLNITTGEARFLTLMANSCSFSMPWTWVQRGTQDEWADDWGLSVNSLKKWLRSLREKGILLVTTSTVDRGIRGKVKDENAFPVWMINPVFIELVSDEYRHELWLSEGEAETELSRFSATFEAHFLTHSEAHFWPAVKCLSDTYTSKLSRIQKPSSGGETLEIAGEAGDCTCVLDTSPINRNSSNEVVEGRANRVRRHRRRKLTTREARVDDHAMLPSMIFGEDPDAPEEPSPTQRKKTPASQIADHFAVEWDNALARAGQQRWNMPATPWSDGSKVAFLSWVKRSFLPDHGDDIELCKQMVTAFCHQPWTATRAPWRVLSGNQTKLRKKVHQQGFRTGEEVDQESREEARRQQAIEVRRGLRRRKREASKKSGPSVSLVEDKFDIDPSDYEG